MRIGEVISYIRRMNGFTQEELADKTYRSQRYISDVERGKEEPDSEFLNMIASFFESEVVAAYICGIRDKERIEWAVAESKKNQKLIYA